MEWLKELLAKYLEDDKVDGAIAEINKEMPKHMMPKEKFNEVNDEKNELKKQVKDNTVAMETLKQKADSVDGYEKKIAELTTKASEIEETAKKNIAQITKKVQLKELLSNSGVHKDAVDLLTEKYVGSIELDDKGIVGADKVIATIRAEKAGLFLEKDVNSGEDDKNKGSKASDITDAQMRASFDLK